MPGIALNIVCLGLLAALRCATAAGPAPVLLGTAANFAVLAKTGVSTVPASAISGNVGVSPATSSSLTGFSLIQDASKQFWTSTQVNGHLMGATDALPTPGLLTLAVLDMQTAYTDASNRPLPNFLELKAGLIGGSILVPGLYKWTTGVTITTGITLAGGPADTWIFQISGGLVQASAVTMTLIGGALSRNIIWAVAGTVSVGANAQFAGNILAQTNVVIGTNAIDNGCIYAQTDVALEKATVLCSGGAVPPGSSSAGSSSASTPSGGSSSSPSGG
ncbi:ice-binding protein, partial [Mycena olivaceomarginata]